MEGARHYLSHVGDLVSSSLGSVEHVLELGAGNGSQTEYVRVNPAHLVCVEPNAALRKVLSSKGFLNVSSAESLPASSFSAAFSINCLEHIKDDVNALRQVVRCLRTNALFVIFVPAFPILYSTMDDKVGHVRRYTKREISEKLRIAGMRVEQIQYVDVLGFVLSLIYRFLPLQSGRPSLRVIQIFDCMVFPLSIQFDRALKKCFGKNLLVVARKVR